MSLSNDNIVTRNKDDTPADQTNQIKTPEKEIGWFASLNPFSTSPSESRSVTPVPEVSVESQQGAPQDTRKPNTLLANTLGSVKSLSENLPEPETSSWFSWKTIFIIIIILLFLGFNVLKTAGSTLEVSKNVFSGLFGNIFSSFGLGVSDTIKRTSEMSATGTKTLADETNKAVQSTVNEIDTIAGIPNKTTKQSKLSSSDIEETTKTKKDKTPPASPKKKNKSKKQNDIEQAFEEAKGKNKNKKANIKSDTSDSVIQKKAGKGGWCFIGEQDSVRSCVKVTANETCMSGNIFPSRDICVNPSLRN